MAPVQNHGNKKEPDAPALVTAPALFGSAAALFSAVARAGSRARAKKISKQTRRVALRKALSVRILAGDVTIVEKFAVEHPKTKEFIKLLASLSTEPKTLVIAKDFDVNTLLASRNVPRTELITSADVNTEHLLGFKKIVLTNDALTEIAERINK